MADIRNPEESASPSRVAISNAGIVATLHLLDHNATLHKEIAITPKDTNPFATQGADLSALSDTFSAIVEGTYSATSEADDLPVLEDVEAASLGEAELAAIGEESPARLENPEKDLSDEECPGSFIYEDSAMRLAAVGNIGLVNSSKVPNTPVVNTIQNPESKKSAFLAASYDVRRIIYEWFFPASSTIQLTYGPPAWTALNPRGEAYTMTAEIKVLFHLNHQVNYEITQMIYATNTFLLAPGAINFKKMLRFPHANSEYFLSNLGSSNRSRVKTIHLFLGPTLMSKFSHRSINVLAEFPRVVITVDPLISLLGPASRARVQLCQEEACRKIAEVRSGLEEGTIWDDCGHEATVRMLSNIMPEGYRHVDGSVHVLSLTAA